MVSASLSKMTFTRPEKLFEENNFLKTFTKVTCLWIWAENVRQDGQTAFTCPVEQCWKVEPLGQNQSFLSLPHILWNSFATSNENGRVVNLAVNISRGIFRGKDRLNETVSRFSPCFDSHEKNWVELSHLLPRCRGERSGRKHNFELNSIFFNLAEWFPADLRTAICVSRRTFSTTFFWKISSFLFWFSDLEQKSCKTFPEMLSAIFAELTSFCPEEEIEKTSVLWKIQTFHINSGLWAIT